VKERRTFPAAWIVSVLTVLCIATSALGVGPQRSASAKNVAGVWESKTAEGNSVLMLNADGSGEFNGKELQWTFNQNVLSLSFQGGSTYLYETVLAGNNLTVNSADLKQPIRFTRSGSCGGAEQANPMAGGGLAGITGAAKPAAANSAGGPEGTWQVQKPGGTFTLVLNPGGIGEFNGTPVKWELSRNILTLRWENGDVFMYNATLTANSLKVAGGNLSAPITFQRVGGGSSGVAAAASRPRSNAGGGPVGHWETVTENGTIQLVLNPDGSGTFGQGSVRWVYGQGTLTLTGPNGTPIPYPASIGPDSMTLTDSTSGAALTFRRAGGAENSEGGEEAGGFGGNAGSGSSGGAGSLAGSWQNQQGSALQLNPDGSAMLNGTRFKYTSDGSTITLIGSDGQMPFPYSLGGNTLTVQVQGQTVIYTRTASAGGGGMAGGSGGGGSIPQDMVGKWCYINVNASGQVSSSSSTCFVLNPDGTYEYSGESSNSNAYGGTASQSSDRGTWRVSGSTVNVNSQQQGPVSYQLQKRNHPKTNDPMLCLDGQCYVTYGPKPPWPY
jgi:hypothetical protein